MLLRAREPVNKSISLSAAVNEIKTAPFGGESCPEKSHRLFIERIKIRARRGYSAPFARLTAEREGFPPCPFTPPFLFLPPPLPNPRLRPCPLRPVEPLRCSLCSPERPRPAINVMHPQTHPRPPRRRTQTRLRPS